MFRIPKENILNVGDLEDFYFGSLYDKDPNADHSPLGELKEAKDKLAQWADAFPIMRIAESNHGERWAKKALNAQIPETFLRRYSDIMGYPPGWQLAYDWKINCKYPFRIVHGTKYSGKTPYRSAAELGLMSVAFGHLHSSPGICIVETEEKRTWAMNTGCLIDRTKYAFKYEERNKFRPSLSIGVILDDGYFPVLVPFPYAGK